MAQGSWCSLTLAAKCAMAKWLVYLPSAVSENSLLCKTLGNVDHALVRSVAYFVSYWFMILHLWEAESAICALCDLSFLPRVFLSVSSVEQKILRFAQDDSVDRAQDDSVALCLTCYSKCHHSHVERSETSSSLFRPTVISFALLKRLRRLRPSESSGEICMLCAAPSSEYAVSDDYSSGAAGSSTTKCSPRAWLLPSMKCYILWTPNALTINYLTINTVGQKYPPC